MVTSVLARRRAIRDQRGFTLVELLLAMTIGLLILGSATAITIGATRHNQEVAQRTDATQRGRLALERMVRLIRSQVCSTASSYPVLAASANSMTFYSDLTDGSSPVYKHTLTFDPTAKTITDSAVLGSTTNPQTFTGTPIVETLATDVVADKNAGAFFRYWSYPRTAPTSGALTPNVELIPSASGLSATDVGRIGRVDISFVTQGGTLDTRKIRAQMSDQVFVRLADPNSSTNFDPSCT